ncbi:TRAP transporter small permease subunit [Granulosicoccaceae sp. 1_MG-2023]|nr:TRAP transporter small permease subunit [Granulosicoccaceae sp. 1_MG-2023]
MLGTERKDQAGALASGHPFGRSVARARGTLAWLENVLLLVGVVCILGLCLIIASSVFLRTFSSSGIPDEVVIVGEMMIGALILPLAFVAADRGFICVEIFTLRLGPGFQKALNVLTVVVGLIAVTPICYAAYLSMVDAYESGGYFFGLLELPKWPGQTLFFLGYFLFFIRLIDLAVHDTLDLFGLIHREPAAPGNEGAF